MFFLHELEPEGAAYSIPDTSNGSTSSLAS
jgi:hypothetical protein